MLKQFEDIKQLIESKGYVFFKGDTLDLNIIFERTSLDVTNYFTDFCHLLWYEKDVPMIRSYPATTKAGIKGGFDTPITYNGVTGTAVVKEGQYRSSYMLNMGRKDKQYPFNVPFLEQIKGLDYYRDGDKDLEIDKVQEQDDKVFFTHVHAMSKVGVRGFPINNWSLGCFGMEEPYFKEFIDICIKSSKIYGKIFTLTLIETNNGKP